MNKHVLLTHCVVLINKNTQRYGVPGDIQLFRFFTWIFCNSLSDAQKKIPQN